MGSSRLPGKSLLPLGGMPSVLQVLRRARAIEGCRELILATTDLPEDDGLVQLCRSEGYRVHRGSSPDVLARFVGAARLVDAEIVVRITGDCPLLDPRLCGDLIQHYRTSGSDYASIDKEFGWPQGLDCEVFPKASLEDASREALSTYDREHVTPWIHRHARRPINLRGPGVSARWVLDTANDYQHLQALYSHLKAKRSLPSWSEVLEAERRCAQ